MTPSFLQRVLNSGVVAILRAPSGEVLVDVAEALLAGGVEAIEVTFTVPRADRVIEKVAEKLGDRIVLGAGTVLDAETARIAILAGAQYIVSPTVNLDVIRMCKRYSKLAMPGAMTPTEVVTAWEAGADVVKIFPSDIGGAKYLKAIKAPLPHIRMMPTGGVTLETAKDFLAAGACALGIGGNLVEQTAMQNRDFNRITALARQFAEIVKQCRAGNSASSGV
jgi:2-dehydro-3-deoxyphosphogluconate aldolase/(4S)-4-hydroxy-2-oxoglutarate aldolase